MTDRRGGGLDQLVEPFLAAPGRAAILCDYDGTLAPIVDHPAAAVPLPGAVETLAALADRFAIVAVISGRPAAFLTAQLGGGGGRVVVSGLYGLESARHDGGGGWAVDEHPEARPWRSVVEAVTDEARKAAPAGVLVEPKGLSVTVHWRTAPEQSRWVEHWVADAAARTGLVVHPAKASAELRLPLDRDKGTVVAELAEGMAAACFLGDDLGDLPAVEALSRLPGDTRTLAVVVGGPETPPALADRADLVVDGPPGALAFLRRLLPAPS